MKLQAIVILNTILVVTKSILAHQGVAEMKENGWSTDHNNCCHRLSKYPTSARRIKWHYQRKCLQKELCI